MSSELSKIAIVWALLSFSLLGGCRDGMDHFPINEEVKALGQLTLVAQVGSPYGDDEHWEQLGEVVQALNIAPVSASFTYLPERVASKYPQNMAQTPPVPTVPSDYIMSAESKFELSSSVRGGMVSAAIYEKPRAHRKGSCIVVIDDSRDVSGAGGLVVVRHLEPLVGIHRSWITLCGDDRTLVAYVWGLTRRSDSPHDPASVCVMYLLKGSHWEIETWLDSALLGWNFHPVGETVDSSIIYLLCDRASDGSPETTSSSVDYELWQLRPLIRERHVLCRDDSVRADVIIPSPDASLLALGDWPRIAGSGLTQRPMRLLDMAKESFYTITFRDQNNYADTPLGWSEDVPSRLFFLTAGGRLWQLDIDVSRVTSATVTP